MSSIIYIFLFLGAGSPVVFSLPGVVPVGQEAHKTADLEVGATY